MATTSISSGLVIYDMLTDNSTLMNMVTKVFPVITDQAILPYVCYRCSGMGQAPVKTGIGADTLVLEVRCFAATYRESVELAEEVRETLDNQQGSFAGLRMRSCVLTNRVEDWSDDAFLQELEFTLKIG